MAGDVPGQAPAGDGRRVLVLLEMAGAELDRRSIAELEWRVRHRLFYRP
jgi:hypothetical protein